MKLGIVSDIHCQHQALAEAIAALGSIDRLICLGDAIDQSRFCNRTVAMLRDHDALCILGNHEQAFFVSSGHSAASVDSGLANWLKASPQRLDLEYSGRHLEVVHSTSWPSGHAYVPPDHMDFQRFERQGVDVVLYGHTHQPVVRAVGSTLVVNPGSIGEGRPTLSGFIRSCARLDVETLTAEIIDIDG